MEMNLEERIKQAVFARILAISVILISSLMMLSTYFLHVLYPHAQIGRLETFLSLFTTTISGLLTLVLILIYKSQNETLDREADILEKQQELMHHERMPSLSKPYNFVTKISNSNSSNEQQSGALKQDEVEFCLANNGGGVAKSFRIHSTTYVKGSKYEGSWAKSPVLRSDRHSILKYADEQLSAGALDVRFKSQIKLGLKDTSQKDMLPSTYGFSEALNLLYKDGAERLELTLELRYEDPFEEEHVEQFLYHWAKPMKNMDLHEFMIADSDPITYENKSEDTDLIM
ncbi:hypothetical protein [Haladaptatus sp. DYF46]|uniref:hypothetical protein n=1 Tax=Haladaptatus sp. DYF46 TaxID=2886041 RepID=UPI001E45BA09|nr:hypothetical protein [Haladaptatus sp. DYF46]